MMRKIINVLVLFFLATSFSLAQTFENAVIQFESREYSAAKDSFLSLVVSEKNNSELYYYMGRIAFEGNEFKDAIKQFEKAIELNSYNSDYYMWLGHSFGRRTMGASIFKQAGYARKCRKNYEKAIKLNPSNIEARESLLQYYLQAPRIVGGGRDKAEFQANEINKIDEISGISAWGKIFSYYQETEKAVNHFTSAIQNHPEEMIPYYGLINLYYNMGDYSKAADIAIQQLEINDTTAAIHYNLGNAQQRSGMYEQALDSYYKTLELDENYNQAFYQIGRLAAISGMYLDIGKKNLNIFISLSTKVGDSWLAWAYYRLGAIEEHLNSKVNAISSYEQALKFNKDFDEAKKALNALQ
jgi:tetratricopeptide (TPR) repeat protein